MRSRRPASPKSPNASHLRGRDSPVKRLLILPVSKLTGLSYVYPQQTCSASWTAALLIQHLVRPERGPLPSACCSGMSRFVIKHPKGERVMTISKIESKRILILFTLAALGAFSVYVLFQQKSSAANFSGAIYTTTFNGQSVNENTYSNKDEVYLNGGPQNTTANGLPDGTYYFQVTDPSGATLLSSDPAVC